MSGRLRKIGRTRVIKLGDGRKQAIDRMEVFGSAADADTVDTEVFIAFGTPHPKYTDCLLTEQPDLSFSGDQRVEQDLVRIYTQMHATDETLVGKPTVVRGEDGRITVEQDSIQLSSALPTPQKVGTTVCPVWPVAMSGITGTASTDTFTKTKHGLIAGDVFRFSALSGGAGLSTGTSYYVIASGLTTDEFKLSATSGGSAIDFTTNVTAATGGLYVVPILASEAASDDGAVRRIKRRYVTEGLISTSERPVGNGLKDVTWVSVKTKLTPTGAVMAESTSNPGGVPVYSVTARQSTAGTAPSAASHAYTSTMQWRAPGRLQAAIIDKTILSPGTIPSSFAFKTLALNKAAPVVFESLDVTVLITYATSPALGTVIPELWDPQQWATADWDYIARGPRPIRRVNDYPGYCVVADVLTPGQSQIKVETTTDAMGYYMAGEGELLFQGGNAHWLTITGPEYPTGDASARTRTISIRPDPDFQALDGTQWYRITQIMAVLPELPAMPSLTAAAP